jgi:hypothetical protein
MSGDVWDWVGFEHQIVLLPAKSGYIQTYRYKDTSVDWPTHNE